MASGALLLLAAAAASASVPADDRYCSVSPRHTMCRFRGLGAACGTTSYDARISEAEKREIVDVHNHYRARVASGAESAGRPGPQPPAADMQRLVWDEELAAVAQRWADQCVFDHDESRDVGRFTSGQNLFRSEGGVPWREAIASWYSEVEFFDGGLVDGYLSDEVTGHYAQMIWGNTRFVGCGKRTHPQGARRRRGAPPGGARRARRVGGDAAANDYADRLRAYNATLRRYLEDNERVLRNKGEYRNQARMYSDYLDGLRRLGSGARGYEAELADFRRLKLKHDALMDIDERQRRYERRRKAKERAAGRRPAPSISSDYSFSTRTPVVAGVEYDHYVCNYGPSGNFVGARVYSRGPSPCGGALCDDPMTREYYPALEVDEDPVLSALRFAGERR